MTPREFRALSDRVDERERRHDQRFGTLAALAANMMRDSKEHPRPYEAADFFPALPHSSRQASDEEIGAAWEAWAQMAQRP